ELTRVALQALGKLKRHRGGEVTVLRLLWTLEEDFDGGIAWRLALHGLAQRFLDQGFRVGRQGGMEIGVRVVIIGVASTSRRITSLTPNYRDQSNSIGSTSRCQRSERGAASYRCAESAARCAWSAGRDADCITSCARSKPARRVIRCGTGSNTRTSGGGSTRCAASRRKASARASCGASARSAASCTQGGKPATRRSASCASAKPAKSWRASAPKSGCPG